MDARSLPTYGDGYDEAHSISSIHIVVVHMRRVVRQLSAIVATGIERADSKRWQCNDYRSLHLIKHQRASTQYNCAFGGSLSLWQRSCVCSGCYTWSINYDG